MEAQGRKPVPSLIELLEAEPYRFNFFQAVRVLLRRQAEVTDEAEPLELGDVVRFRAHPSFEFAASDVLDIKLDGGGAGDRGLRALLTSRFMGLAGHDGPLPDHYTELILRRAREKDFVLRDFLDLFNHRLCELFYSAWETRRFYVPYERGERDPLAQAALALVGLEREAYSAALPFPAEFPVHFAGLLSRRPISAEAMRVVLSHYFDGIPVEVIQFQGRWLELDDDSRFRLGDPDAGTRLGAFCPLGERVWDVQGQIRLRLGPLSYADYLAFSRGGEKAEALVQVFRFLTGDEMDLSTELILAQTAGWQLGAPDGNGQLGRSVWLGGGASPGQAHERIVFERMTERRDHAP